MRNARASVLVALLLPCSAAAGRRVAPVVPSCASELATLEPDLEGDEDRCVATGSPRCQTGQQMVVDAQGPADRCLPQEGPEGSAADAAREPKCLPGLSLEARPEKDVCRRVDKPKCPSGLKLRTLKGDDICRT